MNLGDFQSRMTPAGLDRVGSAADQAALDARSLHAVSGNGLLSIDAWAGIDASGRLFQASGLLPGSVSTHMDQLVSYILAPLG